MDNNNNSSIGVIVCGSGGRMGLSIISLLKEYDRLVFLEGVDSKIDNSTLKDALHNTAKIKNKVIIDFTSKSASLIHAEEAMHYNTPIVIGSTGFSDEDIKKIHGFSEHIPIVLSGNMSLGVNVLLNVVYEASKYLGEDYDCEIIEMHHKNKKDAPSGTAKMLADSVASQKKLNLSDKAVYGRFGEVGTRKKDEIGILSVRAGDIVGEHKVIFAGNDEVIEITHKAISRNNFARGAIKAALWLSEGDKKNGFFDMRDVLNLNNLKSNKNE